MADKFSKKTRSFIMAQIKCKNTKLEVEFRKALFKQCIRGYRLHKKMLGNPDLVFSKQKVIVFLDGDFWHGYNWKFLGKVPPKEYWQDKICRNMKRDRKNTELLRKEGWAVLRFWEHNVKKRPQACINKIKKALLMPI